MTAPHPDPKSPPGTTKEEQNPASTIAAAAAPSRSPSPARSTSSETVLKTSSPFKSYITLFSPTYVAPRYTVLRLVGALGAIGAGTCLPLMAIIFGNFVNDFNDWGLGLLPPDEFKDSVGENALILVWLFIARFGCSYIGTLAFHTSASQTCRSLRLHYLSVVLRQPLSYFDSHTPSSVSSRLTTDVNLIEVGLGEKVSIVVQALSMLFTSFVVGFVKQWKLTLVCICVIPWSVVVVGVLTNIDAKLESRTKEFYSDAMGIADEALASPENVLALGAGDKIVQRFRERVDKGLDYQGWRGAVISSIFGNMFFGMHCAYALALYMGVKLTNSGEVREGGTVLTVMFCVILASSSLGMIAPSIPDGIKAAAASKSVLSLLQQHNDATGPAQQDPSSESEGAQVEKYAGPGNVKLTNISFSYPTRSGMPVLSDLSITIPAGQTTALIGPSGSGKSTIIALLERWYDPASGGTITLDDRSMTTYPLRTWRGFIGLVQQDPVLFDDTIFHNVLNGYRGGDTSSLSPEEQETLVTTACIQANAHEFILALPSGYQTRVGERAGLLSGGQKQRIAIARAIVSDPKILLLDEATSALDSQSEKLVQEALDKAAKGRTTLTIVHNLATIKNAAKIVVMDAGRVVEEGTHEELAAGGGMYCQLLQAQNTLARSSSEEGGGSSSEGEAERKEGQQQREQEREQQDEPLTRIRTSHTDIEATAAAAGTTIQDSKSQVPLDDLSISRQHSLVRLSCTILRSYPRMIPTFVAGATVGLVASAAFPVTAFLFSKLVTVFQLVGQSNFVSRGNFWALMFFFLALSELFSYGVSFYFFGHSTVAASRGYRPAYLKAMLGQDVGFFQIPGHSSGALATLLFGDPEQVEMYTAQSLGIIHIYFWDIISCFVLSLAVYWKFALVTFLGCFPIIMAAGYTRLQLDMGAANRCEKNFLESARFGTEAIQSIRTVSSLMLEGTVIRRYAKRLDGAVGRGTKESLVYFIVYAFSDSVDLLVVALAFWYGGTLLADLELSVQDYFIIYSATLFGGQAAAFALGYTQSLTRSQAAANRITYLTATHPSINSTTGASPTLLTPASTAALAFDKVTFHYPSRPSTQVLRNITLAVRPGESVCLVGRSGSGKSTVLSLVERFFDPSGGTVLVNDVDLKTLDIAEHRAQCAFVGQETILYQGTVRENLLLGLSDEEERGLSDEDLRDACEQANIHAFVLSLPQGYDTNIGPGGSSLSGGQRQRIAIARALLRRPRILLLDEATSALDAENERLVGEAIARAAEGRTVVAATHHVEAMRRADRVVVMDKGRVVEEGSFEELGRREGGWLWRLKGEGEMS